MAKTTEKKAKDMTTREFLTAIIEDKADFVSSNGQTLLDKANALRDAIDKRNATNREKPKKNAPKVDNTEAKAAILEFLSTQEESILAKEIAEATNMTTQKATAVIRQMVSDGTVQRIELSRNAPLEYRKA